MAFHIHHCTLIIYHLLEMLRHPPGNATSVTLHGVDYLGVSLSITTTLDEVTVEMSQRGSGTKLVVHPLLNGGPTRRLEPGIPVSLPRAGGAVLTRSA